MVRHACCALISCLVALTLLAAPCGSAPATDEWQGDYNLFLSDDTSYHTHVLHVTAIADGTVKGRIEIDRRLGPEGRAPRPDEKRYDLAFTGVLRGRHLHFSVPLGNKTQRKYTFDLYFMDTPPRSLAGSVAVTDAIMPGPGPLTMGVYGHKPDR